MTETQYKYVQEDINTGAGTEGSVLIARKIHDTLIAEVGKALLPRELAALYVGPGQIPGSSYDLNLESTTDIKVRKVGEGAEIWNETPEYSSSNLKPLKYGARVNITKEMEEDSNFPLLQRAIQKVAVRLVENETSLILAALQGCTNNVSGGAAITIANIASAMLNLEDADYTGTDMLVGNEVISDLRNIDTFVEADKLGSREMLQNGFIGVIFGMKIYKFSTNAAPTTTYSKYAYVLDRRNAYVIAEKRTPTTVSYEIPTQDTRGVAITQRIVVSRLRDSAICRISTT